MAQLLDQEITERAMVRALELAQHAAAAGEVPVGAVILDPGGAIVAEGANRTLVDNDPTAHAEMIAIREAAHRQGNWRLLDHTLIVTLEPCPMCAGASVWARLAHIVYGAPDPKAGAAWSLYNIPQDARLNHRIELTDGLMADESAHLLQSFFQARRS
jgi:tRNA(adenine34) deaminase